MRGEKFNDGIRIRNTICRIRYTKYEIRGTNVRTLEARCTPLGTYFAAAPKSHHLTCPERSLMDLRWSTGDYRRSPRRDANSASTRKSSLHTCHLVLYQLVCRPYATSGGSGFVTLAENYPQRTVNRLTTILPDIEPGRTKVCFWSSTFVGMISLALLAVSGHNSASPQDVLLGLSTFQRGAAAVGKMPAAMTTVHHSASLSILAPLV